MKKIGTVLKLFISQHGLPNRVTQQSIHLDRGGVLGDKFYNKNPKRSTLLTSTESYLLAKKHNISIDFGQLGENILIDYNPYHLPLGSQLQMGETRLEITQKCPICNHLSAIDHRLPQLLIHDRGIFVPLVEGREIHLNDSVYLIRS
jgi:MOSC domain-containing protein YiiM